MLSLKLRDGSMLNVKVADDARVSALVKASLADIKTDSFHRHRRHAAARRQHQGVLGAYLPSRAARRCARSAWTVGCEAGQHHDQRLCREHGEGKDGETLTVKYKDGEKKVVVTPETVIAAAAPGNKSELKAGAQIIIFGWEKQPDGTVLAKVMYVGRGLTPAM